MTTTIDTETESIVDIPVAGHTTIAERVGADTVATLIEDRDHVGTEQCGPSLIIDDDALPTPIVGLTFRTDFDGSQEWGLSDLFKKVTGANPRRYQMRAGTRQLFSICEDRTALAVSQYPLPATFTWGEQLPHAPENYAARWDERISWVRGVRRADRWSTYAKLRDEALELGVAKPLPRRKDDLIDAINSLPDLPIEHPLLWPAVFTYGTTLIMRADDGPVADIIAGLCDAVDAGTFSIGNSSGPFQTGVLFYDGRDETVELRTAREARHDWYDAAMAELAPVRATLEERGHRFYFLGNPREGGWNRAVDGVQEDSTTRYWVNGRRKPGSYDHQPGGWYTLEELLNEDFAVPRERVGATT